MRVVTRLPLVRRKPKEGVTVDVLKSLLRGGRKSCGCGDLDALCHHIESIKQLKNGQACEWCGEKAYQVCTVGLDKDGKPVPLHFNRGKPDSCKCFFHYHNDICIGLGRGDTMELLRMLKSNWTRATASQLKANRAHILKLKRDHRLK